MKKAEEIVRAGRPLHIIGHSLGGQRAVTVLNDLLKLGIAPDHVFTIDPFIADGTTVAPGAPVTNFYQLRSVTFQDHPASGFPEHAATPGGPWLTS